MTSERYKIFDKVKKQVELDESALYILGKGYCKPNESPSDMFKRIAVAFSDSNAMAVRMYEYFVNKWVIPSSPIAFNAPTRVKRGYSFKKGSFDDTVGMPISCFGNKVEDKIDSIASKSTEWRNLSIGGGGVAGHWSSVRSPDSKSPGAMTFLKTYDPDVPAYRQGTTRRGSYAAWMDITHPQIEEFIAMRRETGGDPALKFVNIHHGINIPDSFYDAVAKNGKWDLIDPNTNKVTKTVRARDLLQSIYITRAETGEPLIHNIDVTMNAFNSFQKELGLKVSGSNICTEITLANNIGNYPGAKPRTFVCVLASPNVTKFDEWKDSDRFIPDIVRFLDNVIEYYINHAPESHKDAIYSASRERAIGIGQLGFHTYLQSKSIPLESAMAKSIAINVSRNIYEKALAATLDLGAERGECPDMVGSGRRNSHVTAIAPNATTGQILSVSPSVEPIAANVYAHVTDTGDHIKYNSALKQILEERGLDTKEVWDSIKANNGSVSHINELSDWEKRVFKTAYEIDQNYVIELALARQPYIEQAASTNLTFPAMVDISYLHSVMWRTRKLKTVYYHRSGRVTRGGVSVKADVAKDFVTNPESCLFCEG